MMIKNLSLRKMPVNLEAEPTGSNVQDLDNAISLANKLTDGRVSVEGRWGIINAVVAISSEERREILKLVARAARLFPDQSLSDRGLIHLIKILSSADRGISREVASDGGIPTDVLDLKTRLFISVLTQFQNRDGNAILEEVTNLPKDERAPVMFQTFYCIRDWMDSGFIIDLLRGVSSILRIQRVEIASKQNDSRLLEMNPNSTVSVSSGKNDQIEIVN